MEKRPVFAAKKPLRVVISIIAFITVVFCFSQSTRGQIVYELNVWNGDIRVVGDEAVDLSAWSVASGDINGDEIDDVIIGAYLADPEGGLDAGKTYVIYGSNFFPPDYLFDLQSIAADITVCGDDAGDSSGVSVSSGDINGDGLSDIIIGAYRADPPGGLNAGETYVIYGDSTFPEEHAIDLNSISADITIYGDDAGDLSGYSVSSGDINGDGMDDVIIGAYGAEPEGRSAAGKTYVIYGDSTFPEELAIDLNVLSADITIYSDDVGDHFGYSVSSGDINGDTMDDIIIGAYGAYLTGDTLSGATYVIYGSSTFPEEHIIDLDLIPADITVYGDDEGDLSAFSVSSGDINGDDIDDLVIGAPGADMESDTLRGETYVIYGSRTFPAEYVIDLNLIPADITVYGDDEEDFSGFSVSTGDINGDCIDDVLIGAYGADLGCDTLVGETYVIYGSSSFPDNYTIHLDVVPADITVRGDDTEDWSGHAVSSGDINGDGTDDLIIGAPGAELTEDTLVGETYIIYGICSLPQAAFWASPTSGCAPLKVHFTDRSTSCISQWSWDFGDEGTSSSRNPWHTYTEPGTYPVSLTVTGYCGSDKVVVTDYITVTSCGCIVTVTSPNGGETWCSGTQQDITWTSDNTGGTVCIEYSTDGGETWNAVVPDTPDDGSYSWTIPELYADNCLVKVYECGDPSCADVSDGLLTICGVPQADFSGSMGSSSPYRGLVQRNVITFCMDGCDDFVLHPCPGYEGTNLISFTFDLNQFVGQYVEVWGESYWCVECGALNVTELHVLESCEDDTLFGPCPLEVCFEDLSVGCITDREWSFGDDQFSVDPSPCHTYMDAGSHTVSLTVTGPCGSDTKTKTDYVSVIPCECVMALTAPNGGETVCAGTQQTITWISQGSSGRICIEYSTDGGDTWSTVVANTPNDGSYSWTVPDHHSEACLVRAYDCWDASCADTSDGVFTLCGAPPKVTTAFSTFNDGLDGWEVYVGMIMSWQSSGGNPGGLLRSYDDDPHSGSKVQAPDKFLGNWSGLDGAGVFRMDMRYFNLDYRPIGSNPTIWLSGPCGSATFAFDVPLDSSWQTFEVSLEESLWVVTGGTWAGLLSNVALVRVSMDYTNGQDEHGLDNVYVGEPFDCNENGIPDALDIANGTSTDIDENGIPDECVFENDIGIEFVAVSFPHSVDYPIPITGYIRNFGTNDSTYVVVWYFVEDKDGTKVLSDQPVGPPWPFIPSGETLPAEFNFTPQDTGTYRACFFQFAPDQYPPNDSGFSAYFRVYPEDEGYMAHHYFLSEEIYSLNVGEGPAVLFDPPVDIYPYNIETLEIELSGTGDCLFHVCEASGPGDTIPDDGTELIEPILLSVPEHAGSEYYGVDVSSYSQLQELSGPFFVWVEMQPGSDLQWTGAVSPFPPTNSFLYDDGEWEHVEYDFNMRCYLKWNVGGPCIGLRGDPTGDGRINVLDILAIANHILGVNILTGDALCRADCTGDGVVNILDALAVANVILGILPECPGEGACKPEVTPEVMELMASLKSYLPVDAFAEFMALVKGEVGVPTEYSLAQNYPNPFNPTTDIGYQIPECRSTVHTSLKIFNVLGQEVRTLVDEPREAGYYSVTWDGLDNSGCEVASGIYFYRLTARGTSLEKRETFTATKKMTLIR